MHTLEVTQIARSIAKALLLNEDLTEAIALSHDLGHTPFGHAGERALNKVNKGGFKHHEQSVRVVSVLEKHGRGLNLSWEVIDGIRNHQTVGKPSTLEGRIVQISDKLAYVNHDIDDAERAGVLSEEDIPLDLRIKLGMNKSARINNMVLDVIKNSDEKILMSDEMWQLFNELHDFMFVAVYKNPVCKSEEVKAAGMIEKLYSYYKVNYELQI
jgi:dGTPase